ncbi:MAG: sensor histidine kinase [Spirochaetales bacterium]|nr:sensor histidine kinase [Spirochaetales bacterium]MCF7938314.1 sensor histidine kinase [Spirochaetales bacterium]
MKTKKSFVTGPVLISGIYFLFGFLWILLSDRILLTVAPSPEVFARIQTYKGWVYVLITTILIYALLHLYRAKKERALDSLRVNQEKLKRNLAEREVLLREIHHRVKNNMQIVISLIRLKTGGLSNKEVSTLLEEINNRIYSIALIHEHIYKSDNFTEVDMKSYIESFSSHLVQSSPHMTENISMEIDVEDLPMHIDQAVSCGIILNEALNNCLQHAFPGERKGTVSIRFFHDEDSSCLLQVEDDGQGFDSNGREGSFGLEIIRILAEQINARLAVNSGKGGTLISLTLKESGEIAE